VDGSDLGIEIRVGVVKQVDSCTIGPPLQSPNKLGLPHLQERGL